MCDRKATRIVTVTNAAGVHARAATLIGEVVRGFDAEVILRKGHEDAKGTEILQMLSLGAGPGDQVALEATGSDAERVLDALEQLFARNFAENEENPEEAKS
jgi:phosphotransferase system HPr (HPr) family protein